MNWRLKAIVQKTISYLPAGYKVNYLFQKYITKGVVLSDDYFYDRLDHAKRHIGHYQENIAPLEGKTTLELGTGWYPVVPISNFLCGADTIYTVDITPLTNLKKIKTTLAKFIVAKKAGKLAAYLNILPARWKQLEQIYNTIDNYTYTTLLEALNLKLLVEDARKLTMLTDRSIDLIHSNNTFEHVYADILEGILIEFHRLVAKGGMMSHFIDMSDHFAHNDRSITIYNFLQFSKKRWKRIDNSIQPQNRLRFKDFLTIYERLTIPVSDTETRPGNLEDLQKVAIHRELAHYNATELAISHGYIFSHYPR